MSCHCFVLVQRLTEQHLTMVRYKPHTKMVRIEHPDLILRIKETCPFTDAQGRQASYKRIQKWLIENLRELQEHELLSACKDMPHLINNTWRRDQLYNTRDTVHDCLKEYLKDVDKEAKKQEISGKKTTKKRQKRNRLVLMKKN